jgi:hypothetical protein
MQQCCKWEINVTCVVGLGIIKNPFQIAANLEQCVRTKTHCVNFVRMQCLKDN